MKNKYENNLPITIKKLNIFKKIRIELFLRNLKKQYLNFDFKKYGQAPEYIKRDNRVVDELIDNIVRSEIDKNIEAFSFSEQKEAKLLIIPEDVLLEKLREKPNIVTILSDENQVKIIQKHPDIWREYLNGEVYELVHKALKMGKYDFVEVFPEIQETLLEEMEQSGVLQEELPRLINYLKEVDKFIQEKPELLIYLDKEKQQNYIKKDKENFLRYASVDIQLKYIEEHKKDFEFASELVMGKYVEMHKDELQKEDASFQYKILQNYPLAYKYASDKVKNEIWSNSKNPESIKAAIALLDSDTNYSKKIIEYGFDIVGRNSDNFYEFGVYEQELAHYLKECDEKKLRQFFEKSKLMSSKGNILPTYLSLHGSVPDNNPIIPGVERYSEVQKRIIRDLKTNQIAELIKLDSNYILPYLAPEKILIQEKVSNEDMEESKDKCKTLFKEVYGEEAYKKFEDCIETIYAQYKGIDFDVSLGSGRNRMLKKFSEDNIFINEFKILFNKDIMQKNSPKEIKAYYEKLKNGEDTREEFYTLMGNAYGESAVEVLRSRSGLNVHTINSLEDFDSRIMDNFGEGFVHNLLNYNIRDHQEFMGIIKDTGKLENFKNYYEILSKAMGNNVETMQKAISEYNYFEELLQNCKDVELTDKQNENLILVLLSKDNQFDIKTLQELQNYDNIFKEQIMKKIKSIEGKCAELRALRLKGRNSEAGKLEDKVRDEMNYIISENILGFRVDRSEIRDYGDKLGRIVALYDISQEMDINDGLYNEQEMQMLDVLRFLENEKDVEKLLEFATDLVCRNNIQMPIVMHQAINKLKEHQTELFNSTLLTPEKMEELCKQEAGKKNPGIKKEITKEGLTKYILKGIDFRFMPHWAGGMHLKELMQYEGQLGVSSISTRLVSQDEVILRNFGHNWEYVYTSIKESGGIQAYDYFDANTDHVPRRIHGSGGNVTKLSNKIDNWNNEIAQNRNIKDNDKICNDNMGGKNLPDAVYGHAKKEDIEIMKKYNIPIIVVDKQAYLRKVLEKQQKEEQKKVERQKQEEKAQQKGIESKKISVRIDDEGR